MLPTISQFASILAACTVLAQAAALNPNGHILVPRRRGGGGGGGSGSGSHRSVEAIRTISFANTTEGATTYSPGGANREVIPAGTRFAGRERGGGTRSQVIGGHRMGSGFPYSSVGESEPVPVGAGVAGVSFPFGFWPLWFADNYAGSAEYSAEFDQDRPGGGLVMYPLTANTARDGESGYFMIGDRETIEIMVIALSDVSDDGGCFIDPGTVQEFDGVEIRPENVLQFYRASSFALAYTGYENTYARSPLNGTASYFEHDPFPEVIDNSYLLDCFNTSIARALPILDPPAKQVRSIIWWVKVIGGALGGVVALVLLWFIVRCIRRRNARKVKPKAALDREAARNRLVEEEKLWGQQQVLLAKEQALQRQEEELAAQHEEMNRKMREAQAASETSSLAQHPPYPTSTQPGSYYDPPVSNNLVYTPPPGVPPFNPYAPQSMYTNPYGGR